MTKINKLVMTGFKSFAKRTEIVFGPKFNCVLGPNGSGKSNILDSLCFVLGKSSTKSLRAEKSSNLIYNGGKSKKPAKEGRVSIYFDNTSKIFPVPEKEVKITRIIKQSGQGVYKINDKVRTRQEILELMNHAKINPDGYNIILQGDIVRLVEMSTTQRRQLIEEIAGISMYEDKKNKSLNELGRVDERLKEADIILRERSTHLKELKNERDQALKHRELTEKIRTNKASYLHQQIRKKKDDLEKAGASNDKNEADYKNIQQKIKDLKNDINSKKDESQKISDEIESKGEKEQVKVHKQVEDLRVRIAEDGARIKSVETEIERIGQRKEQMDKSISEIQDQMKKIEKEIDSLQTDKGRKTKLIAELDTKLAAFKKKHKMDDASGIDSEIEDIDKQTEEKEAEIQKMREEQHNILREKDKLEYQVQNIDEKMSKVLEIEKEHKMELQQLKDKRQEFKKITLELNKLLNEDSSLASQLGVARARLITANENLSKEKAKNIGIKESVSADLAVREILKKKSSEKGIYGTVSDLGKVSSKHSLALEIAAGARLKSIVVETDAIAARCIRYLKEKKLGIATFLPINKINPIEKTLDKSKEKQSGVHGYAINLTSFEPRFRKIFQYVFSDTLVVDNIDVARRLGIGSNRMVTIEGDVVEKSGAMQGGFRQKRKTGLGFSEKEVDDQIEKLEREVSDLRSTISLLESKRSDSEQAIITFREKKANLEGEIIKMERGLHLDSDDMEVSRKIKKEIEVQLKEVDKKEKDIQNKVSSKNRELAHLKIKRSQLKNKIAELRSPTLLAELNTFEEKKRESRESLIRIDTEIKNLEDQKKNIFSSEEGNAIKIQKQLEKEMNDFEKELDKLKKTIKDNEGFLKEKEEIEKKFYKQFKSLFDTRNKITEQISRLERDVEKSEEKQRDIERRMNTISLENARIKAELAGLEEDFAQYEGVKIIQKEREALKREIIEYEAALRQLGLVNEKALEIYETVEKEYHILLDKKEVLNNERQEILVLINKIEAKKTELFLKTLEEVNRNFKTTFKDLSHKGDAYLELENPKAPFEAGLLIKVKISSKKFMDLRSLSGGEKTLTALAFLFAVQEHDPAYFYVLDEVDAALDKRNSEKLAKKVRQYCDRAQYIVISHNDGVITEADNLYGVSMNEHGMTKVVSLKI